RLEARFLDHIKRVKVLRRVQSVIHSPTLKQKATLAMRMAFCRTEEAGELDLRFQIRNHIEESLIEPAVRGNRFLDGDVGDVQSLQLGDPSPLPLVDHVDGVQAVPLAK